MLLLKEPNRPRLVIYFQVHQPKRLRNYSFFDIGSRKSYFDDDLNGRITKRIASECYLPANGVLLDAIRTCPEIAVNFSISGTALDLFEQFAPEVIESFKALAHTGRVEFLSETSHHSLSSLFSESEFTQQLDNHRLSIQKLFGQTPSVVRNTELIYNDRIGAIMARQGYKGVISEVKVVDTSSTLEFDVYEHPMESHFKMLLRCNKLSDAISFRYRQGTITLPLSDYISRLYDSAVNARVMVVALDYETFGEHFKADTGILRFLRRLLIRLISDRHVLLSKASEAIEGPETMMSLSVPSYTSWADESKDLTAWLGNDLQKGAFSTMKSLESQLKVRPELKDAWRHLQTSDHYYYMCTKGAQDGDVHSYFSHYNNPYEAYINFMNVLKDVEIKLASGDGNVVSTESSIASTAD
ncbi:alpha-amylase [Chryseolinea sp. T2]|uniref:alpha-amylase n=1 Tax=Chryseolinea sp. T2 TaxID=3129255 RepID=UPI003077EFAE